MKLSLVLMAALVTAFLVVTSVAMKPSPEDLRTLAALFGSVAVATAFAAWWLSRTTRRFTTLRNTIELTSVAGVIIVGAAVAGAALSMLIEPHDLQIVLLALGLGAGLAIVLAFTVGRRLTSDLHRLVATVRRVGAGHLRVATGIDRDDEVGAVAEALDGMILSLEQARLARERDDEARRNFLAAVGHDLRTPLAALQAGLEALQDGVASDPQRYLASMARDVEALGSLVEDVALLARFEAEGVGEEPVAFEMGELLDEASEALAPLAEAASVRLSVSADNSVLVDGSPSAMGRVIRNLMDNALRFSPHGGTVRVMLEATAQGAKITVADEGQGFPPGFADRAFERFATADPSRSREKAGFGLGLAIARSVVEAHGGSIWAEGPPGGRVSFTIPASDALGGSGG